jgi:hypothetical protein
MGCSNGASRRKVQIGRDQDACRRTNRRRRFIARLEKIFIL